MNDQNNPANTSTPILLPAKRKRGRPRKDGNVVKKGEGILQPPATPVSDRMRTIQQIEAKPNDISLVGSIVSGVIDGCFDAGYFLSVRIGNNGPPLRGVIFEPGRIKPISPANDVAPNTKMHQRRELPIPAPNQQSQGNGIGPHLDMQPRNACSQILPSKPQSSGSFMLHNESASSTVPVVNMSGNNSSSSLIEKIVMPQNPNFNYQNQSQSTPLAENLRMVEQDEMMQVYEVSIQSEGLMADAGSAKDWMSESSVKQTANNILPGHKEIMDQVPQYQNLDVGFFSQPSAPIHNQHNCSGTQNLVAVEPQTINSEVNEIKDPCHELHQSSTIAEDQPLLQEPLGIDSGFQQRELVRNESQVRKLELHETPIAAQNPSVPLANENVEPELHKGELIHTQMNGPNSELHQTPIVAQPQFLLQGHQALGSEIKPSDAMETPAVEKLQSVSMNPENTVAELEPSKFVHYDLENQNFGILRDFVAGNHHYLPPEVISDQPMKIMIEKSNSRKCNTEKAAELEPKTTDLGNNESSQIGKSITDPVESNELDSQTAQRTREAMPFDLELAAEESPCPGRAENKISISRSNPNGLSESEPR